MATLDVHVEAPPKATRNALVQHDAEFVFNKTIAGHYRNGREYEKVGVLLLTWKDDDLNSKILEVKRLQEIFEKRFHYTTDTYEIPSEKSETGLHQKIANFAYEYDQPNNLMILYYSGHAYTGEESQALKLAAKWEGDGDGNPRAFFNDFLNTLRLPDTDILVIIDCCFAGKAFANGEMGKRKFELLASTSQGEWALAPKHEGSFTKILSDVLDNLLDSEKYMKGFSTSKLYRDIYHNAKLEYKPYLFDQSRYDYGKIWLRPLPATSQAITTPKERDITIDLTLHLTEAPNGLMMNELAKSLQYLPHVQEVVLAQLHAPEEDIKSLRSSIKRVQYLLRWARTVRARRGAREISNMYKRGENYVALLEKQHYRHLYDWNDGVAQLRDGTFMPVRETSRSAFSRRDSNRAPSLDGQNPPAKIHYFLGLFSVAYSLNLPSVRSLLGKLSMPRPKQMDANGHIVEHTPLEQSSASSIAGGKRRVPTMVSVVDQAVDYHSSRTSSWDVFIWAVVVFGVACLWHVSRE